MARLQSSKAVDRVSTQLERMKTEMPREAGRLRDLVLRLDRVANTLEVEESVSERVARIEGELEDLGVDFTVEPNSSHKEATCIYAYRGQLDPREEPSILGRVAKKYGSLFENTSQNQPYKITIPHN
jgi:hypothetical protein